MTLQKFMDKAISPWMRHDGPDSDIVLSSRIRLARNFAKVPFPIIADVGELEDIRSFIQAEYESKTFETYENFKFIMLSELTPIERRVLVEKHLISPHLAKHVKTAGSLRSEEHTSELQSRGHL